MRFTLQVSFFLLLAVALQHPQYAHGQNQASASSLTTKSLIPFRSSVIEKLVKKIDPKAIVESPMDELDSTVLIKSGQDSLELNRLTLDVIVGEFTDVNSDAEIDNLAKMLNGEFISVAYPNHRMIFFKSGRNTLMVYTPKKSTKKRVEGRLNIPVAWDPHIPIKDDKPAWLETAIDPTEAVKIGRFILSGGKSNLRFPLADVESKSIYYIVDEDKWLHREYRVLVQFEMGRVVLDSQTGALEHFDISPNYNAKDYEAKNASEDPIIYEKPLNYVPLENDEATTNREKNYPQLIFNGSELFLKGRSKALHFPPLKTATSCSLNSQYFSSFLIAVAREGQKITLEGQLPDKGKKAELTLGDTHATVDGKPVTLSDVPKEIEGQLYLPYEVLTLCNGVLTRYEADRKTLYVDTRFIRRPETP